MTTILKAAFATIASQDLRNVDGPFLAATVAIPLLLLSFESAFPVLVDLRKKRSRLRRSFVHPMKYEIVESAAQSRASVKVPPTRKHDAINVAESNLPLVQLL